MNRKINAIFITLLLGLCLLSQNSTGQILGFKIEDDRKKIKIPFEIYNNLIVIPVVVNNQLPLRFVLDTGVRTTILTEKVYGQLLQLEYSKKYTIAGIGETPLIEAYVTSGVSLTLPGISGKGHAMLVLEEDYLELRNYLGTEVHGVLGYELFSRFIVGIDSG
ncbi:MAG: retropepsin-like aspartic protease [Cyclobacteriaceae bacterium]